MVENTAATLRCTVTLPHSKASPGELSHTNKMIQAAHRDHRRVERFGGASESLIERVVARLDATLLLPLIDLAEGLGMLDLVITTEADVIDVPILEALDRVRRSLAQGMNNGFHRDRRVVMIQIHEAKAAHARANAAGSDEKIVARGNGAVDRAYRIEPQSLREASALLDLIVTADREAIDAPVLTALANVAACLKRLAAS